MTDANCIFCRILSGEIPSYVIYEDDDFKAILDASPATKGHALLLPKNHAANLFELGDEVGAKLIPTAKKIALQMKEKLNCDGLNLVQNNGEVAGQTVNHFHLHMIPRYKSDEDKTMCLWTPKTVADDVKKSICETLKL